MRLMETIGVHALGRDEQRWLLTTHRAILSCHSEMATHSIMIALISMREIVREQKL